MDKRSFLKRVGLLAGLALLNPLRLLGLFKPEPITKPVWDDYLYFATKYPQWERAEISEDGIITGVSYWDGKQWKPVED
jgi:hypothetical protein